MPWRYEQSTGRMISPAGMLAGTAYSGAGVYKNRPDAQSLKNQGPIPCGIYTIGKPYDSKDHGPYVLPLHPHIGNQMFGRDGFLIHGESLRAPGAASQGCIVLNRVSRECVGEDEDSLLEVVPGTPEGGPENSKDLTGPVGDIT